MTSLKIQYENGRFQFEWTRRHVEYIETNPLDDDIRNKFRSATEDIKQGVAARNLQRPQGDRIANRDFSKWVN